MVSVTSRRYQRNFIIFSNEDRGFEEREKPSGYVKFEVRDMRGKLSTVVQNLRNGNGKFSYSLYLIQARKGSVKYVRAGEIKHIGIKAELELTFDPTNFDGTTYAVDDFNVYAILVEYENRMGVSVTCPLAAYRNGQTEWRSGLRKAMQENMEVECAAVEKSRASVECVNHPLVSRVEDNAAVSQLEGNAVVPQSENNTAVPKPDDSIVTQLGHNTAVPQPDDNPAVPQPDDNPAVPQPDDNPVAPQSEDASLFQSNQAYSHEEYPQWAGLAEQLEPTPEHKPNTDCDSFIENPCTASVKNECRAGLCQSCQVNKQGAPLSAKVQPQGNLKGLEDNLNESFEISDPFHSGRSDYIWWTVTNPLDLNDMLHKNNIPFPLMFNPTVMSSYHKYKHLIIGVFKHKTGHRYVVCGVPGMHMVDLRPSGEISMWVWAEGCRHRYGAFGYWLVYINPKDGKVVNFKT